MHSQSHLWMIFSVYTSMAATLGTLRPRQFTSRLANTTFSPTATSEEAPCSCVVRPIGVQIGEWWDTTYSVTTATVVTKFTQYNDTLVSSTTTLIDSSWETTHTSMPYFDFGIYGTHTLVFDTKVVIPGGNIVTSPANYYILRGVDLFTGTLTTSDSITQCVLPFRPSQGAIFDTIAAPVSTTRPFFTDRDNAISFDQEIQSRIRSGMQLGDASFDVASCEVTSGEGAPFVHVPMQALTDYRSETVTVKGLLKTSIAPVPAVTPAAPANSPSPLPAQTPAAAQPIQSGPQPLASPSRPAVPAQSSVAQQPAASSQPQPAQSQPAQAQSPPAQSPAQFQQPSPQPSAPQQPAASSQLVPASMSAAPAPAQVPSQAPSAPYQGQPAPSQVQPQPHSSPAQDQDRSQQPPATSQLQVSQAGVPQPQAPTQLPTGKPALVSAVVLASQTIAVSIQTSSPAVVLPGDITLRPGKVITISSQILSLQSAGGALVVLGGSSTTTIPLQTAALVPTQLPSGTPAPVSAVVLGLNTFAVSVQASSPAVILPGGVTLRPGEVVTFFSQVLSLQSTGSAIVVLGKSSTTTIPLAAPAPANNLPATVVTIASATIPLQYVTGSAGGVILPNGKTLLPGSATEVNGVTVSLAPSATQLVVGTSTVKLIGGTPPSTSQPGAGDYIWSGIGGGPTTSAPAQFTGSASRFSVYAPVALASIACALFVVWV